MSKKIMIAFVTFIFTALMANAFACTAVRRKVTNGKNFGTYTGRNCMQQCEEVRVREGKLHKYRCECVSGNCYSRGGWGSGRGNGGYGGYGSDCRRAKRKMRQARQDVNYYCY